MVNSSSLGYNGQDFLSPTNQFLEKAMLLLRHDEFFDFELIAGL